MSDTEYLSRMVAARKAAEALYGLMKLAPEYEGRLMEGLVRVQNARGGTADRYRRERGAEMPVAMWRGMVPA